MIEWIVSSCTLIAAVLLLRLVFQNKISKRLQYALWALVVLRLLIPGSIIESAASVGNLLASVTQAPVVQVASGEISPEVRYDLAVQEVLSAHDYPVDAYSSLPQQQQEAIVQAYEPQIQKKLDSYEKAYDTVQLLNALWTAGCAVMGLVLLGCNLRFYLKLKQTRKKLPITGSLPVYQTAAVQTPCLFGPVRPSIYLPDSAIDEKAMAYILAHEQTHHRHLDHIWALVRCICLAIHWYNPLVWIAVKVSRTDSELACDEGTLARLGDDSRESYGRTLIEMSCARPSVQDYLLTATTMTGDKNSLYRRIKTIAKKPQFILSAVISLLAVALVIIICTFTGANNNAQPTEPSEDDVYSVTLPYPLHTVPYPEDEAQVPLVRLMKMLYILDEQEDTLVSQLPDGYVYIGYCMECKNIPVFNNSSYYIPSFTELYASPEDPDYVYYDTGNGYQRMIRASLVENKFSGLAPDWNSYEDYRMEFFDNLLRMDGNNPYYQAAGQDFLRPENVDLFRQFSEGFIGWYPHDIPLTDEEEAFLTSRGWGEKRPLERMARYPVSVIDQHLQRFFGITFDQSNKIGLDQLGTYNEENQCYYGQCLRQSHRMITLISVAYEPENNRYHITYECEQEENSGIFCMSLIKEDSVFLIDFNCPTVLPTTVTPPTTLPPENSVPTEPPYHEDIMAVPMIRMMGMLYVLDKETDSLAQQLPDGFVYLGPAHEENGTLPKWDNFALNIPHRAEVYASLEETDYIYYDTGKGYQRLIRAALVENEVSKSDPDNTSLENYLLAFFNTLLRPNGENPYCQAAGQDFAQPEAINLNLFCYNGFPEWKQNVVPLTEEEKAFLTADGWGGKPMTNAMRFPISAMDARLQKYLGISFRQTWGVGLDEMAHYRQENQCYYAWRSDARGSRATISSVERENNTYRITYQLEYDTNTYCMTLIKTDRLFQIYSNIIVKQGHP